MSPIPALVTNKAPTFNAKPDRSSDEEVTLTNEEMDRIWSGIEAVLFPKSPTPEK